jgi:hypothetical protein
MWAWSGPVVTVDKKMLAMKLLFWGSYNLFTKKTVIGWQHFSYLPHIAETEEMNQHLKKSTANFAERREIIVTKYIYLYGFFLHFQYGLHVYVSD